MSWAQVSFVARRAASNLRALFWTHMLTSGTMAMTLFIFGAVMLVEVNLQALLKGWGDDIQMSVYLENGLGAREAEALMTRVSALPEVLRVRYISQEQAWRDFSAALGAQSGILEGLPRDVLPASLEIALKPGFRDAPRVEWLAGRLQQEKGVKLVEYPRDWIDRLSLLVLAVGWLKWLFAAVMFIITFFIVTSAVKLAILSRTDEIEIMQLVGASRTMVQAPFVVEGMTEGFVGGVLAVLALWGVFQAARAEFAYSSALWGTSKQWLFLGYDGILTIVLLGWALGTAGSYFSLRRYVRTWRHPRV
jgi:cell division transport system permease protein